ncbi:hypothetical protein [Haloarchaeobius amylolyticus]|uniref:hypothetical protein n=1 Tax=Haloarchaeobius amylolyticus TaxID=1198296 RepID=UPI002271B93C|nr:hypothetical protein [Haloarchaeobius amylolyticus]
MPNTLEPPDYPRIAVVNRDRPELWVRATVHDEAGKLVATYEGRLYPHRLATLAWVPPTGAYRIALEYDDERHETEWQPGPQQQSSGETCLVQVRDGEFECLTPRYG